MGYTANAIKGFSWQTIQKIATIGLGVVKMVILARILSPLDFGLFSIVTIALGVAEATTETGVNFTIINSKHSIGYFLNTAWVIAIVRGFLIGSVMLVAALFLSQFFEEERLLLLVSLASLTPVIKGFINPAIVALRKELRFYNESGYHLSRILVETLLAIILTIVTRDISALLFAMIGAALFEVAISFIFFSLRPQFQYLHSRGKIILEHAGGLSITALLSYLNENLDNLLIGKIVSPYGLGLYHNSYSLTHKVTHDFGKSAAHGTFAIFSKMTNQPHRLQRAVLKSIGGTLGLSILASLPLLIWPNLVVLVLGSQWVEAVPLIRLLVLGGLLHGVSSMVYSYFMAQETLYKVNIHLFGTAVLMAFFVVVLGSRFGLQGAVWGIFLSRIITFPLLGFQVYQHWQFEKK